MLAIQEEASIVVQEVEEEEEEEEIREVLQDKGPEDPEEHVANVIPEEESDDESENEEDDEEDDESEEEPTQLRRSTRDKTTATHMNVDSTRGQSYGKGMSAAQLEFNNNITHQTAKRQEYDESEAQIMAMCIHELQQYCNSQQHLLHRGLKIFGKAGKAAAIKEVKQLHDRTCFKPILVSELTEQERRRAQLALMYLSQKRDGTVPC